MMRGRMVSLTAVAIALALAGPARAMVEQHELDGDGLKKAAQENKALAPLPQVQRATRTWPR